VWVALQQEVAMSAEKRRDKRDRMELPALLVNGKREVPLVSGDVRFSGLFLRTDDAPPLRQLVRVKVKVPPANETIEFIAMAVFVVPAGVEGRVPGVGLRLFAVQPEVLKVWQRFVQWVAKTHPESLLGAVRPVAAAPDATKRQFPRAPTTLQVRLSSVDDLAHLVAVDASRGGMFLQTHARTTSVRHCNCSSRTRWDARPSPWKRRCEGS